MSVFANGWIPWSRYHVCVHTRCTLICSTAGIPQLSARSRRIHGLQHGKAAHRKSSNTATAPASACR